MIMFFITLNSVVSKIGMDDTEKHNLLLKLPKRFTYECTLYVLKLFILTSLDVSKIFVTQTSGGRHLLCSVSSLRN